MKGVAIVSESHTAIGSNVTNVYIFVNIDDKFAFWMNFDEHFLFIHGFNNFSNVRALFLLQTNLEKEE